MVILMISQIRLLRDALVTALCGLDTAKALGACSFATVGSALREARPSVVVVDASHPDAAALVAAVRVRVPEVRVVVLAPREDDAEFLAWADIGIAGYLGSDTAARDLVATVRRAAAGEVVCPPRLTALLFSRLAERSSGHSLRAGIHALTSREREVAALLADGLSSKLIARRLCVAVSTVKNHIHNILDKWQVRSRGEAAACYRQKISEDELGLPRPARPPAGPTVRAWSDAQGPAPLRSARPVRSPVDPQGRLAARMAR